GERQHPVREAVVERGPGRATIGRAIDAPIVDSAEEVHSAGRECRNVRVRWETLICGRPPEAVVGRAIHTAATDPREDARPAHGKGRDPRDWRQTPCYRGPVGSIADRPTH